MMNTTASGISLAHVRVEDAMHPGILSTDPATSLRAVAKLMASHHVHCVVVVDKAYDSHSWSIVSAQDVAAAAASGLERTAGEAGATELLTVSSGDRLDHAAQLMAEHELGHLIVVDRASGQPVGILSTLDIAAAYGS